MRGAWDVRVSTSRVAHALRCWIDGRISPLEISDLDRNTPHKGWHHFFMNEVDPEIRASSEVMRLWWLRFGGAPQTRHDIMKAKRKRHDAEFKARVALEALKRKNARHLVIARAKFSPIFRSHEPRSIPCSPGAPTRRTACRRECENRTLSWRAVVVGGTASYSGEWAA
jgi:hypothetical protein